MSAPIKIPVIMTRKALDRPTKGDRLVLAEYRCGCSWVGRLDECFGYCEKHGGQRRRIFPLRRTNTLQHGWNWS